MAKHKLQYGSDIEGARDDLEAVAVELEAIKADLPSSQVDTANRLRIAATTIRQIVQNKMWRRFCGRTGRTKRGRVTAEKVTAVKMYAEQHPEAQQVEIAVTVGLGPGRVSEILNGSIYIDQKTGDVVRAQN